MVYHIPLTEETDCINSIGANNYEYQANQMPFGELVNNEPQNYSDFIWETAETGITEAVVNGVPVAVNELIGGAHPPQRPR